VRENNSTGSYLATFEDLHTARFEHQSLDNATSYYYEVTAVYRYGESAPTPVVEGIPHPAEAAPLSPPWVKITDIGGQQLQIDWGDVNEADSYTIYFKIEDEAEWRPIENASPIFVHSGLIAKTSYQYKLRSINSLGESEDSELVSVMIADRLVGAAGDNTRLRAVPMDGQIVLDWQVVPKVQSQTLYFSTLPYGDIKAEADFGEKLTVDSPPWSHADLDTINTIIICWLPCPSQADRNTPKSAPNRINALLSWILQMTI